MSSNKITAEARARCSAQTLQEQLAQWRDTLSPLEQTKIAQAKQSLAHDQSDVTDALSGDALLDIWLKR